MKKIISLLLVLMIGLLLCSCQTGKNNSTEISTPVVEHNSTSGWTIVKETDEFGDVVENGSMILATNVKGNFSNTATANSELDVLVMVGPNAGKKHFVVTFSLMEYGNHQATYTNSDTDKMTLKTKIGDTIQEYRLFGVAPNGSVSLGYNNVTDGDTFVSQLYAGNDIRCIINIGSSQYNFTIASANFADSCVEMDQLQAQQAEESKMATPQEALQAFGERTKHGERYEYIVSHKEEYPFLSTDEINEILLGHWVSIEVEPLEVDQWYLYHFKDDGVRYTTGRYYDGEYSSTTASYAYSVENGTLLISATPTYREIVDFENGSTFQFRKIIDGYFLVEKSSASSMDTTLYIYIQYDDNGYPVYPVQ